MKAKRREAVCASKGLEITTANEPKVKRATNKKFLEMKRYFAYTTVGSSMIPFLRQNRDIVEIHRKDPTIRCKRYDIVLYKRGDQNVLHRVLKVRQNDYIICGDHNFQREYGITDAQIYEIMTRVIRNVKSIYTTDWKYRVYVHLCMVRFFSCTGAILYIKKKIRIVGHKIKEFIKGQKDAAVTEALAQKRKVGRNWRAQRRILPVMGRVRNEHRAREEDGSHPG